MAAARTVQGQSNCTCRYAGQSYALKTCVCLVMPAGARMACCGLVLNNTSWTFTGGNCKIAMTPDRIPAQSIAGQGRQAVQDGWTQVDRWLAAAITE